MQTYRGLLYNAKISVASMHLFTIIRSYPLISIIFFNTKNATQFDTIQFFGLLFLFLLIYYLAHKSKWILLAEGILFYCIYSISLTLALLVLTLINYLGGIAIHEICSKPLGPRHRKRRSKPLLATILLLSVITIDVSFLVYYKYLPFFVYNISYLVPSAHLFVAPQAIIPLGISFFTFEFLHYIIDIYRGVQPITSVKSFFVFIFFFPTLIAGPIKRFEQFIPQLSINSTNWERVADGMFLIIKGMFKKLILADSFAYFATQGFDTKTSEFYVLVGIYAFAIQIYYDFSGYSDIARGIAGLYSLYIPINFLTPYAATSIQDFWRRWHITLMNWFRDYIYIPLGGSKSNRYRNIFIVFLLSGLWHGAAWNFIIWGMYNALLLVCQLLLRPLRILFWMPYKLKKVISIVITFHLVLIGWIFFRAGSVTKALTLFLSLFHSPIFDDKLSDNLLFALFLLAMYLLVSLVIKLLRGYTTSYTVIRLLSYSVGLVYVIINLGSMRTPFIYFQF